MLTGLCTGFYIHCSQWICFVYLKDTRIRFLVKEVKALGFVVCSSGLYCSFLSCCLFNSLPQTQSLKSHAQITISCFMSYFQSQHAFFFLQHLYSEDDQFWLSGQNQCEESKKITNKIKNWFENAYNCISNLFVPSSSSRKVHRFKSCCIVQKNLYCNLATWETG